MEQGEKYACAELMVDEIKSAGGIMPKVSQTLAMKPDVVKEGKMGKVLPPEGWGKLWKNDNRWKLWYLIFRENQVKPEPQFLDVGDLWQHKPQRTVTVQPRPDQDDFVRSALKSTQTENPAKSLEDVRQYVVVGLEH